MSLYGRFKTTTGWGPVGGDGSQRGGGDLASRAATSLVQPHGDVRAPTIGPTRRGLCLGGRPTPRVRPFSLDSQKATTFESTGVWQFGVGGSEISARKTTTAADWSQTMRYFSWAFFASNSLFAPSRSPTGPRAWVGCGRPSGASLDANLAARPRVRDAPLGARRGLPSTANQAGRVKTSPLIRFFSSGLWRIGR